MSWRRQWTILSIIIFLATLVRLTGLNAFPPLLTQDEASLAYNAWSIAQTGRDEWGTRWPLVFTAFGDAKQPVYIYLSAVGIKIFGWSLTDIRWLSALAGSLTAGLAAALVWLRTHDRRWTLAAGVITALAPWMVHLSRMALESTLALMFFLLGLVAWELGAEPNQPARRRWGFRIAAALAWILASYTYIAYRLFIVMWLAILWLASLVVANAKKKTMSLSALFILTLALILPGFVFGGSGARLGQVGIFRPDAIRAPQIELRNNCYQIQARYSLPALRYVCAGLWNQATVPVLLITRSWLDHLSPQFLFFSGDSERYRNPLQTGALYVFLAPFYGLGLFVAVKHWRKHLALLLGWGASVLPSVLTAEPQAFRLTPHFPFVLLLIILGGQAAAAQLPRSLRPQLPLAAAALAALLFFTAIPLYLANTFGYSQNWLAYGREVGQQIEQLRQAGYTVYVDNVMPEPHIFWATWNRIPPANYHQLELNPSVDPLGFRRPTTIGPAIIFTQLEEPCLTAASPIRSAYLTLDPSLQEFTALREIRTENGEHVMARVYDLSALKQQLSPWDKLCGEL